jgi:hypothetical protein
MTDIQVEVKQEDLETLVNSEPVMRMRLQNIAFQRTINEQAAEIRRLNEEIAACGLRHTDMQHDEWVKLNKGEDDAKSG